MDSLAPFATSHARNGMVCSVDHLASSAGIAMLRAGGSAADAAIATSAVLAVTTQHLCGMGGDLWALVHHADGQPPTCLNASGRAGSGADAAALRAEGHRRMPTSGDIRAVTVPGCVDGWLALHERHGRLSFASVLEPAIAYATDGFPVTPVLRDMLGRISGVDGADEYPDPPVEPGDTVRRPRVAATLDAIAAGGRDAFYRGAFGRGLERIGDGLFIAADLDRVQADWVSPVRSRSWDHEIFTTPPNSQGYLTLAGSWIAERIGVTAAGPEPHTGAWAHAMAEAARLAGHDRPDVLHESASVDALLDHGRLRARADRFRPERACELPGAPHSGDTIYLCAVDREGMGVSLIQSNANGWGAHLTVPETGVFLHNRGIGFSLAPGHPAEFSPGRRPPHTLAPALVQRRDGTLRAVVGTMGGDSQPQVVQQLLARTLAAGQDPATAIAAPRWRIGAGGFEVWTASGSSILSVEGHAPGDWAGFLAACGHDVRSTTAFHSGFGHAHLIERAPDGMLAGASDPRARTGSTVAW